MMQLPNVSTFQIFEFIDYKTLYAIRKTNKQWKELIDDNSKTKTYFKKRSEMIEKIISSIIRPTEEKLILHDIIIRHTSLLYSVIIKKKESKEEQTISIARGYYRNADAELHLGVKRKADFDDFTGEYDKIDIRLGNIKPNLSGHQKDLLQVSCDVINNILRKRLQHEVVKT